ncbi:MAG: hypothetical protein MI739_00935 [Bacteroidales bacterium]|nr:hypothetical protein [Bacteroidales bacterium]
MIIDSKIKLKYNLQKPYFEFIQSYLDKTLMKYAQKNNYAYSSRIKNLDSICEKIETGRYSCWSEIDDFIACVLIIPNLDYEDSVIDFLEKSFNKILIRKKGNTYKSFDVFRFDSTRFIGTINSENEQKKSEIHSIRFEVQIRSAFEHAWSVTTHDLAYKSDVIDWSVLRFAAQLKASVEQLDMITLGAKDINKHITKSKCPEIEIKIEILNYLKNLFAENNIPEELKPKDFSRVVENVYNLVIPNLAKSKVEKRKCKLKEIFKKINNSIALFNRTSFPMSLSLFQIIFGILFKEDLISKNIVKKSSFYKSESFELIFNELSFDKITGFKI